MPVVGVFERHRSRARVVLIVGPDRLGNLLRLHDSTLSPDWHDLDSTQGGSSGRFSHEHVGIRVSDYLFARARVDQKS